MSQTTITRCTDVKVGDKVTEIDTPEGPFYAVLSVDQTARSYTVDADETGEDPLPLDFHYRQSDAVLVAG